MRSEFIPKNPLLVTLTGENQGMGFDLSAVIDSVGQAAGQIGGLVTSVKGSFAPAPVVVQQKQFDFTPYIIPASAIGMVLLIALLRKK